MKNQLEILLKKNLRVVPNFPKKGIMFQDIFSLIEKPRLLKKIVSEISKMKPHEFDKHEKEIMQARREGRIKQ